MDLTKPIVAGISGGPDSLCMLDLLRRSGQQVIVGHFDHHLRPESGEEARRVEQITHDWGLDFVLGEADVACLASAERLSIEEAARISRYRWLFLQAEAWGAQAVAVAHTADDQVETVLMHLLRGAGVSGLKGMAYYALPNAWSSTIPLIRPMLGIWRREIETYLCDQDLDPIQDESNQDVRFYRNRIRRELIPRLEQLKPDAAQAILRMTQVLGAEDEIFEALVDRAWEECQVDVFLLGVSFEREAFLHQPLALQRRLVRRMISRLRPGLRDIDFETVKRTLDLVDQPPPTGQANLAAGLSLFFEAGQVFLAEDQFDLPPGPWPQLSAGDTLELPVPGKMGLSNGWVFRTEFFDFQPGMLEKIQQNADPYQAWLDAGCFDLPLHLRSRRSGDRFAPLGMGGMQVELAEWMLNQKMPRRARAAWPLVVSGDVILWVPGYRSNHLSRITGSTRRILHLSLSSK